MASYDITLADRTGRRIGLLNPYGQTPLQFQTLLSAAGSATITPNLTLPLISGTGNRRRLTAWGSEIIVERTSGPGTLGLVWEGPVTKPHADVDGNSLTITAATPWAWLAERTITEPHTYGGWDQLDIARDLIKAYTTGLGVNGDIRMALGGGKSGIQVNEVYQPTDNKQAGQAVEELAATVPNGFDFDVQSWLDPQTGRVMRLWQPYYPQKGRRLTQKLHIGRGGLRAFSIEEATQIATRVTGTGQLTLKAAASSQVEGQFGIHTKTISLVDANSLSKLQAQVDAYLKYRTPPVDIVSWQFRVTDETPFGMIEVGDTVPIFAERGWAFYDNAVRVISVATSVDAAGSELVTCTAAGVPGGIS